MSEMISNESNESNGDGLTALYLSGVQMCSVVIFEFHRKPAFASPEFASTPPCPYAEVRSSELKTWLELDRNGSLRAG